MVAWWNALTLAEQFFTLIGVAATVLLVLQIIMMIVGAASGGADVGEFDWDTVDFDTGLDFDTDADFDAPLDAEMFDGTHISGPGDRVEVLADLDADMPDDVASRQGGGLRLFTMQGVVTFFAIFGWLGLALLGAGLHLALAIPISLAAGFLGMLGMALIMKSMLKLQQNGTMDIRNAVGKTGTVYLPVYATRKQPGKITVLVQGSYAELDAVTDADEKIPTGAQVTVLGVTGGNTLVVKPK